MFRISGVLGGVPGSECSEFLEFLGGAQIFFFDATSGGGFPKKILFCVNSSATSGGGGGFRISYYQKNSTKF